MERPVIIVAVYGEEIPDEHNSVYKLGVWPYSILGKRTML